MKEDAQLVCPVSYEDPDNKWEQIQTVLQQELPLRDVTWKSPISSSFITINSLPLRFLPSSASLFKETEHAFRWLLAPYIHVYVLIAENMDAYKAVKGNVKKWIDAKNSQKSVLGKAPWFILYVPQGTEGIDTYNKVNYRISNDFYTDRTGDHSVMLLLPHLIDENNPMSIIHRRTTGPNNMLSMASSFSMNISSHNMSSHGLTLINTTHVNDVLSLLREGIVRSFQQRCALYDSEIRRLDSQRGTSSFDFRQLFLVKESLALMYQMMQLFDMSLAQYEELEAILSYTNMASLPETDWPMVAAESVKVSDLTNMTQDNNNSGTRDSIKLSADKDKDAMTDAVKNGDEIVSYSINIARMKIVKNKMTKLELHRYVYARQMYFLIILQRPIQCATNSRTFLLFCYNFINKKLNSESLSPHKFILVPQFYMWILVASVKVVRVCCDLIYKIYPNHCNIHDFSLYSLMHAISNNKHRVSSQSEMDSLAVTSTHTITNTETGVNDTNPALTPNNEQSFDNKATILKESYVILAEILSFSTSILHKLSPILFFTRQYVTSHILINPTTPVEINSDVEEYFGLYHEENSGIASLLNQEFDNLRTDKQDSVSNVLVSLSQRLRSVSHYWAKIYSVESIDYSNADGWKINRDFLSHRNRAGFIKVQIERGLQLETMVTALLSEAMWELYTLSDRIRFAQNAKIQLIMTLFVSKQYALACSLLHDLISVNSAVITDNSSKSSQLWHHNSNLSVTELWHDSKVMLMNMHISMLKSIASTATTLERQLACRSLYLINSPDIENYKQLISDSLQSLTHTDGSLAHSKEHKILLPLPSFISYKILYPNAHTNIEGNLYLQENKFSVNMVTYEVHPSLANKATISITNHYDIPINELSIVYKRLHPHIHEELYGYGAIFSYYYLSSNEIVANKIVLDDMLTGHDDEFTCNNVQLLNHNDQTHVYTYQYDLAPHILGDFYLDRIVLTSAQVLFIDRPLLSCISSKCKSSSHFNSTIPAPFTLLSPVKSLSHLSKQSLNINAIGDILPCLTLSHYELQAYFDAYALLQFKSFTISQNAVVSSDRFLNTIVHSSLVSAYTYTDCLLLTLQTAPYETLNSFTVAVHTKQIKCTNDLPSNKYEISCQENQNILFQSHSLSLQTPVSPYKARQNSNAETLKATNPTTAVSFDIISPWTIMLYKDCDYQSQDEEVAIVSKQHQHKVEVFSTVPSSKALALQIPFEVNRKEHVDVVEESYYIQLEIEFTGNLFQNNCLVPFVMKIPHSIAVQGMLSGQASCLRMHSSNNRQNICIYAHISNLSSIDLDILGYSVLLSKNGLWEDIATERPDRKLVNIGEDLSILPHTKNLDYDMKDKKVLLLSGEEYHFNVILEESSGHDELTLLVQVYYLRQSSEDQTYNALLSPTVYSYALPCHSSIPNHSRNLLPRLFSCPASAELISVPLGDNKVHGVIGRCLVLYAKISVDRVKCSIKRVSYEVYASEMLLEENMYKHKLLGQLTCPMTISFDSLDMTLDVLDTAQYVSLGLSSNKNEVIRATKEGGEYVDLQIGVIATKVGGLAIPPIKISFEEHGELVYEHVYEVSPTSLFREVIVVEEGLKDLDYNRVFHRELHFTQQIDVV